MRELNVCEVGVVAGGESHGNDLYASLWGDLAKGVASGAIWDGLKIVFAPQYGGSGRDGFGGSQYGGNDAHDGDSSHGTRGW